MFYQEDDKKHWPPRKTFMVLEQTAS